ncbi:spermatogenesis-associated protein 20 isoform X8 [Vulpes vulpes]|uniref:Spermatogenesis-associated protein 20 n=1 Tax=Vulpes vulpes TaxID=9627 RepID=A0ABM4ZM55_VULVU
MLGARAWLGRGLLLPRAARGLPTSRRGSSSRDKDRSVTVSSSVPMPIGGKGSRTNCSPSVPQKVPNRLISEKSPYLLQHAYNPVDWYPWGQEAFDKARKENKPIFLSVGYSTCHWCHMMEEESFQNEEIGRLLNEDFVSVKVDREERPDVDKVYMTFVQATSSGGGWPMNVWLTPNLQPFVGGTYFPPEDGLTRVGFRTVLLRIREQWKQNKNTLLENSQRVTTALLARSEISMGDRQVPPSAATMNSRCFQQLDEGYDEEYGGFAEAPKFPTPVILNFLFSYWLSHRLTQDGSRAQQMALHTLKMMANGGIRDHVGQGFHRYSTDRQWHIPHFEKMLYDQAQLAVAYSQAFQSGGFYSAEDADSPPERGMRPREGAFYVWTVKEVQNLLPEPVLGATEPLTSGQLLMKHYGLTEAGNISPSQDPKGELQGQNVLTVRYSLELTAARFGLDVDAVRTLLNTGLEKLFQARKHRPKPHLDSKMLAAWNDQDGAEPSANSVSAHNLLRMHGFTGHKDWMDKCVCLLTAFSERMRRVPVALPEMVRALSAHQQTLKQIVICGDPQAKDTKALLQCVHSIYIPNKVLILANGEPSSFLSRQLPFLSTLRRLEDRATAYVCEDQACSMPITEPCELRKLLHQ